MKLESKSLGKTFEFVTFEKEENGKAVTIITHDSLEDVIHNQCEGVNYDLFLVESGRDHSVASCTMYNENRKITAFGETVPETLESDIARNHPSLICTQRAFDRAAIRFLALPGKCFSNTEINIDAFLPDTTVNNEPVVTEVAVADTETVIEEILDIDDNDNVIEVFEDVTEGGIVSAVVETEDDGLMISDDIEEIFTDEEELIEDVVGDPFDFEETPESKLNDLAGYVVSIKGKHAGETIGEIWEKDQSYITNFLLTSYKTTNEDFLKDLEKIKEFVELKK
jgi:hypothetical protein